VLLVNLLAALPMFFLNKKRLENKKSKNVFYIYMAIGSLNITFFIFAVLMI